MSGKGFGRQGAEGICAEGRRNLERIGLEWRNEHEGKRGKEAVGSLRQGFWDLREEGHCYGLELGRGRPWVEREGL